MLNFSIAAWTSFKKSCLGCTSGWAKRYDTSVHSKAQSARIYSFAQRASCAKYISRVAHLWRSCYSCKDVGIMSINGPLPPDLDSDGKFSVRQGSQCNKLSSQVSNAAFPHTVILQHCKLRCPCQFRVRSGNCPLLVSTNSGYARCKCGNFMSSVIVLVLCFQWPKPPGLSPLEKWNIFPE